MRAERRHELKENDLEHYLSVARDYLDKNGKRIGMLAVVAGAIFVAATLYVRSQAAEVEGQWQRKSQLSFADAKAGRESLDTLAALAQGSSDERFVMSCLMDQGQEALRLSTDAPFPPDRELNDKARQAFQQLSQRFPRSAIAIGTARLGLATVEENDFILDGRAEHKEQAAKQLAAVISDPTLDGLPFKRLALDRQKRLDEVFSPMRFQPPSEEELEKAAKALEEAAAKPTVDPVGPPAPDQPNVDQADEAGEEAPDAKPPDPGNPDAP